MSTSSISMLDIQLITKCFIFFDFRLYFTLMWSADHYLVLLSVFTYTEGFSDASGCHVSFSELHVKLVLEGTYNLYLKWGFL
jgi:hypothetical protein